MLCMSRGDVNCSRNCSSVAGPVESSARSENGSLKESSADLPYLETNSSLVTERGLKLKRRGLPPYLSLVTCLMAAAESGVEIPLFSNPRLCRQDFDFCDIRRVSTLKSQRWGRDKPRTPSKTSKHPCWNLRNHACALEHAPD